MSSTAPRAPGRRSAEGRGRRVNLTTLLAVVLPLVSLAALLAVRPAATGTAADPPALTALTRATLVCPSALPGSTDVAVSSSAKGTSGPVRVGLGRHYRSADIAAGRVTTVAAGSGPVAVVGEDGSAPGLVAGRSGGAVPAATGCPAPAPTRWFTGVGAGAGHRSVLELVNPDAGTAVADITVYGRSGVVDAPRLRGVSVPGGTSVRLDLASVVPRRDELALQVVASRGRIGASVLDRYDEIGSAPLTQDWLAGQAEPATDNLLMGLAPGSGRRTLVVANGGDDEVRAQVRVVTDDSVFAPQGVAEIRVGPQSVERISLSTVLQKAVKEGATGLLVTASGPVTATVRSIVGGDLSDAVPGDRLDAASATLLPPGGGVTRTVQLAGATRAGAVTVVSRSAAGRELDSVRADVAPDRGTTVRLPAGAALVTVTPARTTVAGSVLVSGRGAAVVPLTLAALNGLVPAVRPGLP